MEYFNHPAVSRLVILGAAARAEEERRVGNKPDLNVTEPENNPHGPARSAGDSFFWGSLKPFAAAAAVAVLPHWGLVGALLFLVLYNIGATWGCGSFLCSSAIRHKAMSLGLMSR